MNGRAERGILPNGVTYRLGRRLLPQSIATLGRSAPIRTVVLEAGGLSSIDRSSLRRERTGESIRTSLGLAPTVGDGNEILGFGVSPLRSVPFGQIAGGSSIKSLI